MSHKKNDASDILEKNLSKLRQWCEDDILYLRCVKPCTDEVEREVIAYNVGDELKVYDVTCNDDEINFWVDSGGLGVEFIVPFNSDEFDFFIKSTDDAET